MSPRTVLPAAVVLGALNSIVFLGFEWVVKDGTDWLWNDLVDSDAERWRVVPLAIAGSIVFSLVLRLLRQPRVTRVATHMELDLDDSESPTLQRIGVPLAVGATGLLAGASLGPELPLFTASAALGAYIAARAKTDAAKLLILSSAGALLVAFFASLVPVLIPALLVFKQQRDKFFAAMIPVLLAAVAAYVTLHLLHHPVGYGTVPGGHPELLDYASAFALGVLAVLLAAALRRLIVVINGVTIRIDDRTPWLVAAVVFGAVLGLLYLAGGQTVQFSGSEGTGQLLERRADYTTLALAGIVLVKLLVTGWSLSSGYRGGLVFPSVFSGVALSLVVAGLFGDLAGPGILVGAVAGILTAMTSAVLGPIVLLSLLPWNLVGVGLAGAAGAVVGDEVFVRIGVLPRDPAPASPASRS